MGSTRIMSVFTLVGWTTLPRGELAGQVVHEARHHPLGHHVGDAAGVGAHLLHRQRVHEGGGGAGGDDRGARLQVRQRRVDGVDDADPVRVEHVGPGLQGIFALLADDAGVGDHDVKLAELGDAAVDRLHQLRPLAHVGLHRDHPAVQRLDQAGGLLQVVRAGQVVGQTVDVVADVDGDDVRALLGQPDRVAPPLAAAGPGDEGHFALDASHAYTFLLLTARTWPAMIISSSNSTLILLLGKTIFAR
jgi:hypothetical protein